MQEKILDVLRRKHEYISGEELSAHLKISRQALWKHIQQLKDAGYDIVAVPHLGYHLVSSPDRLFPSEVAHQLNTKIIGRKIYYFDAVNSTMDIATSLGIKGAPEGMLVLAETQQKGRGRMGRPWVSPKYKGIYASLVLKPPIPPQQSPVLTLLSAVSICEAIRQQADLEARIKWPNDIFMQNKKLGGILTEINAEQDEIRFVIVGFGLNVNNERRSLPPGATSLREQKGEALNRVSLLQEILRAIEGNYLIFEKDGPAPVLDKWRAFSLTLGRRVKVNFHNDHLEGEATDLDADGALLIRNDSGMIQKVTAGDVVHCR